MALKFWNRVVKDSPSEGGLLADVTVRLIEDCERDRFDELLRKKHYLKNANAVGAVLRYVAEYRGQWLALLTFASPALHIKPRDRWLNWPAREVERRRHLLAQNSRFLVLADRGSWPNLASRVLKLACQRISDDWQERFAHPILALETFVDPERFLGTCYKAAGWVQLGATHGSQRNWQDFYIDTEHPKELWVKALSPEGLEQLRADELPPHLSNGKKPLPPPCPVATEELDSLWELFRDRVSDSRKAKGKRHELPSILTIAALASAAGCKGPHAIHEFAESLNHGQRRRLRCRRRRGNPRQCDVPGERTFRRALKKVDPEELKAAIVEWSAQGESTPPKTIHLDGKVLKNADPAPAQNDAPEISTETPPETQKPKADKALTLVNFIGPKQRLIDQIAVPQNTNEEAAVAAHIPKMDLVGSCITADAAHTVKGNARQLTQYNGADYFLILKGNQPTALAKAEQLLSGDFSPSG